MKKGLKKRVKEVMEKYKQDNSKVQDDKPVSPKNTPKPSGGFTARPDKKRG